MSPGELSRPPSRDHLQGQNLSPPTGSPLIDTLALELFLKVLGHLERLFQDSQIYECVDRNWTISYQLVCHRWRDVICSTPQFWQEIEVRSSPKWLELCLTRCAGALATVTVKQPEQPAEMFAILRRFASSIRVFCLVSHVRNLASLPGLPSFLATPMPALETLYLGNGKLVNVPITHNLFPRLTTLFLCECAGPRAVVDTAVYTSLRNPTLFGCPWIFKPYENFLEVLRMCHGLEYLSPDENILDAFTAQIGSVLSTSSLHMPGLIVLPRLRTLQLIGHPDAIFRVLTTIHAPQASGVGVWSRLTPPPIFTRILGPNPALRHPFLSSPHAITLSCWHEMHLKLSLRCRPEEEKVCSIVDSGSEEGSHTDLELNLVAVMDTFSVASIDTLKLEGYLESAETWQRLFTMFSRLRVLTVEGAGSLGALCAGLARATKASLAERVRDGLRAGAVCCPLLSEIAIGGNRYAYSEFSASSTLFERVHEALCARADAGAPLPKKLQLHLPYTRQEWLDPGEHGASRGFRGGREGACRGAGLLRFEVQEASWYCPFNFPLAAALNGSTVDCVAWLALALLVLLPNSCLFF